MKNVPKLSLSIWRGTAIAAALVLSVAVVLAIAAAIASCSGCARRAAAPIQSASTMATRSEAKLSEGEVLARAALGIVRISIMGTDADGSEGRGSATGIVVWKAGKMTNVLTANHVVAHYKKIDRLFVDLFGEAGAEARVEATDQKHDLALLLAFDDLPVRPIALAKERPSIFSRVYVVGYPEGQFAISEAFLAGPRKLTGSDPNLSGLSVESVTGGFVFPGTSGGALISRRGELLGVVNACYFLKVPVPQIGSAIPIDDVRAFLAAHGVPEASP